MHEKTYLEVTIILLYLSIRKFSLYYMCILNHFIQNNKSLIELSYQASILRLIIR